MSSARTLGLALLLTLVPLGPAAAAPSARQPPTLKQAWSVKTGQPTATVAHATADRVYLLAGAYVELGTPHHTLLALDAATGKVRFRFSTKGRSLFLDRVFPRALGVRDSTDAMHFLNPDTGASAGMQKAAGVKAGHVGTAVVAGLSCATTGSDVACFAGVAKRWRQPEAKPVSRLWHDPARVCYGVAVERAVVCRKPADGELLFRQAVPPVPGVKEPGAVNFTFALTARHLVVANYDGVVTAWTLP